MLAPLLHSPSEWKMTEKIWRHAMNKKNKALLSIVSVILLTVPLAGCPIWWEEYNVENTCYDPGCDSYCFDNSDCLRGYYCDDYSRCHESGTCDTSSDCSSGYACDNFRDTCVPADHCYDDYDCYGYAGYCDESSNICIPTDYCWYDEDCEAFGDSFICSDRGVCEPDEGPCPDGHCGCSGDSDCAGGWLCEEGLRMPDRDRLHELLLQGRLRPRRALPHGPGLHERPLLRRRPGRRRPVRLRLRLRRQPEVRQRLLHEPLHDGIRVRRLRGLRERAVQGLGGGGLPVHQLVRVLRRALVPRPRLQDALRGQHQLRLDGRLLRLRRGQRLQDPRGSRQRLRQGTRLRLRNLPQRRLPLDTCPKKSAN
jgi:hypothetical protein